MRLLNFAWFAGILTLIVASPASAQQFTVYLSTSFDQPTGSAYAFAETTADYSTGYYYDVCVGAAASGYREGYTVGQYDDYLYSHDLTCDATDAYVNWWFSVPTDTESILFYGIHYEFMYY